MFDDGIGFILFPFLLHYWLCHPQFLTRDLMGAGAIVRLVAIVCALHTADPGSTPQLQYSLLPPSPHPGVISEQGASSEHHQV